MLVPFVLIAALPQMQRAPLTLAPVLSISTARPRVDIGTTFRLSGPAAVGVIWDFGDGTAPQPGGSEASHVYRRAGTFAVKATTGSSTAQQSVTVVEPRRVVATPLSPAPGKAVSLRLEEPFGTTLQWSFGDGTRPVVGGASVTHTFAKAGSYAIAVRDAGTETPREFKLDLPVGLQGPGAPFSISYLALRWEDGAVERSVRQGEAGLVAFADLKFEGTGQLQAEWVVDGLVQRAVSQQLGFAKLATLRSGQTLTPSLATPVGTTLLDGRHTLATTVPGEFQIALPTNVPGEHRVTLKVLQPKLVFQVPVIRYFVKLAGGARGPVVLSVSPANAKPGEEVELSLTGTGFSADMTLNLGKDVAVMGAPVVLSPEKAIVKIFIAPTAQAGTRLFQARRPGGSSAGTAHLEIVPALRQAGIPSIQPGAAQAVSAPVASATPTGILPVPATQIMQGSLPGGKVAAIGKAVQLETPKPAVPLLLQPSDKGKKPIVLLPPVALRAPALDLVKIPKAAPGFSRIAGLAGGKGLSQIVDANAAARKEKTLACTEGQKLKLSKITLNAPSFSLIGVNTSGEFQSDNLPVLRDTTQFTWKEKNSGTSEYFELRFYNAKDGNLLKSVRVPGNRNAYEVTPAFVQELGRLALLQNVQTLAPVPSKSLAKVAAARSGPAKVGTGLPAKVSGTGKATPMLQHSGAALSKPGASPQVSTATLADLPMLAPDPDIPAAMRKKADVVWQLVGFRSYPCLPPEDLAAQAKVPDLRVAPGGIMPPVLAPAFTPGAAVRVSPVAQPVALSTLNLQPSGSKARSARPGAPPAKPAVPGVPSVAKNPPSLDKGLASQSLVPSAVAELPKVYQSVAAEVSRSEVWPLKMPTTPQGVNAKTCTVSQNDPKVVLEPNKKANEGASTGFALASALQAARPVGGAKGGTQAPKTVLDENTYTFDQIYLHGTFDLGQKVPYRVIPGSVNNPAGEAIAKAAAAVSDAINAATSSLSPFGSGSGKASSSGSSNPMIATTVNQVTFKNVFVDWGDGTLEPFSGKPLDALYTNGTDFGSSYKVEPGAFSHTYSRSSTYRVKVFVLSDEDMVRDGIVGEVAQGLTPTQSIQGVFTRLSSSLISGKATALPLGKVSESKSVRVQSRTEKAVAPLAKVAAPTFGGHAGEFLDLRPSAAQALERAYVVYCHDLIVKDREDPCANLPVHLVSAELEFPKDEPVAKSGKVQTMGGAPQSPKALQTAPTVVAGPKATMPPAAANAGSARSLGNAAVNTASRSGLAAQPVASLGAHGMNAAPAQAGPNLPSTTPCNLFYSAVTRVKYYGQGTVRVVWKVDERQVGSREVSVKSPKRVGLKAEDAQTCKNPLLGEVALNSPALPVDSLGRHLTTVEAYVLPDQSGDLDINELTSFTNLALGKALQAPMSPRLAHTLADSFRKTGSGKPPVSFGLLNPSQAAGQPAYVALRQVGNLAMGTSLQRAPNGALTGLMQLQPPYRVETRGAYEVKATQPDKVCNLFFPTKGGNFPVTNLGSTLKLTPDGTFQRASGKGLLVFGLRAGTAPDTVAPYPLDVKFSDWKLDGVTVTKGQIELQPNQTYDGPGVNGKLLKVRGEVADKNAPQDMFATLKLSPTDTSMVLTSDGSLRPSWTVEAPVTTQGDWIAKGLKLETTVLGPTPWAFSATDVILDLSSLEGADPKGGKSSDWVGVSLGKVTLIPATLGIQGGAWTKPLPQPTDWTIEGQGVNGNVDVGPWTADYRSGNLAIATIHFKAKNGHYSATYKDVAIRSPWFKDPIKGDASWVRMESGTYMLNLDKLHVDKRPILAGGPMALEPLDLQFTRIKEGGLLMQGRARISLKAENKALATFEVDRVGFGLDGLLYFGDDGARSAKAILNRASSLGPTPADLQEAMLTGGSAKDTPLNLRVNAKLRLSENPVIPGTPVTMDFRLQAAGAPGAFTAPEVKVSPFSMDVAFPLGSPSLKAKINTNYQPGGTVGGAPAMASNRFSGEVDLSMFGGMPVKAQFVLGYEKGKDYFATRVDVPVGPSGTPIIPEIIHLYRLSGGFAYNFGLDVFKDGGSIANAKPDFKGETLFMAGARVGSGDGFIYTLDGQLVVRSSGAARMDFGAWLLSRNPSGAAPLRGCLEFSGGNFDGRLWGGFSFLGDTVALELGASEQAAACSLHFGGGNWRIYAGDRNGQRIVGRLMGTTANAYMMLGNEVGLAVGGGTSWYLGAGVGVKAYAKGWMDMGLQITPQARIIGDFGAGMEAGVCAFGACVTAGVSANVHAEALPIAVSASCCVDLPWPLGDICFTVKM
jgi:hypothetical protein